MDIMETIVFGKRGEKSLPRVPLQGLLLTEMQFLRDSVPDFRSGYSKSDKSSATYKDIDPENKRSRDHHAK